MPAPWHSVHHLPHNTTTMQPEIKCIAFWQQQFRFVTKRENASGYQEESKEQSQENIFCKWIPLLKVSVWQHKWMSVQHKNNSFILRPLTFWSCILLMRIWITNCWIILFQGPALLFIWFFSFRKTRLTITGHGKYWDEAAWGGPVQ